MKLPIFFAPAILLSLNGSFACEPTAGHPCLSEANATTLQAKYLGERKIDLKAFHQPDASYHCFEQGCYWAFFYDGVRPMPGNHFMVVVRDPSGAVELVPGL